MKRIREVPGFVDGLPVKVLDYDRNKYCAVKYEDGQVDHVKRYAISGLPKGFNFHYLPEDYREHTTNKMIAAGLRANKRYHFKLFCKHKVRLTIKFYSCPDFSFTNVIEEFTGTRRDILKLLRSKKEVDNFSISIGFYRKNSATSGMCFSYKDKMITRYSFRNKKQDHFIKQLPRSLFNI